MLVISFPTFHMLSKILLHIAFCLNKSTKFSAYIRYTHISYSHISYFLSLLALSYIQLTPGQCQDEGLRPSTNLKVYV